MYDVINYEGEVLMQIFLIVLLVLVILIVLFLALNLKVYFEFDNLKVKRLKEEYEALQTKLLADRSQGILIEQWNGYDPYVDRLQAVIDKYHDFITALNRVIVKYKEDNGLEL